MVCSKGLAAKAPAQFRLRLSEEGCDKGVGMPGASLAYDYQDEQDYVVSEDAVCAAAVRCSESAENVCSSPTGSASSSDDYFGGGTALRRSTSAPGFIIADLKNYLISSIEPAVPEAPLQAPQAQLPGHITTLERQDNDDNEQACVDGVERLLAAMTDMERQTTPTHYNECMACECVNDDSAWVWPMTQFVVLADGTYMPVAFDADGTFMPLAVDPTMLDACAPGEWAMESGEAGAYTTQTSWLAPSLNFDNMEHTVIVASVQGSVLPLTFEAEGCRAVQLALEVAETTAGAELAAELHGNVLEAIQSPHGNYVIQKIIEVMPAAQAIFIVEELMGKAVVMARHRYGCRILCRLVEQFAHEPAVEALMEELLAEASDLCRHSFAHHVLQCILEYSPSDQQQKIVDALSSELHRNVRSRNATFVIQKVLTYSSAPELDGLVAALLRGGTAGQTCLARNRAAPRVAKALSELPEAKDVSEILGTLDFRLAACRSVAAKKRTSRSGHCADDKAATGHFALPLA